MRRRSRFTSPLRIAITLLASSALAIGCTSDDDLPDSPEDEPLPTSPADDIAPSFPSPESDLED